MTEGESRGVQRGGERSIKTTEMGRQKASIKGRNIRGYVVGRMEQA